MARRVGHLTLVLLVLLVLGAVAGCATSRGSSPPRAVGGIADLAGTWAGTLEFGAGEQPCTLTIERDGRAAIVGRTMTANGQVAVSNGRATYSFPGRSDGNITLYDSGGQRQLQLKGTSGVFEAWVTPATPR